MIAVDDYDDDDDADSYDDDYFKYIYLNNLGSMN